MNAYLPCKWRHRAALFTWLNQLIDCGCLFFFLFFFFLFLQYTNYDAYDYSEGEITTDPSPTEAAKTQVKLDEQLLWVKNDIYVWFPFLPYF